MYRTFTGRKRYSRAFHAEDMNKDQEKEIRENKRERSLKCLVCAPPAEWFIRVFI